MIEISEQGKRIGEADIAILENEFGAKLPYAYRQFLLSNNGGVPSPDVVDVVGVPESPTDIQVFFGIGRTVESSNLVWNLELIRNRFPNRRMLPIACDSGGNLFCLTASKNDDEFQVQYCDINDRLGTLYDVAPNFDSFLNRIRRWEH